MPAYKYEALEASGRTQQGLIEADTPRAARSLLRERGLTPLSVTAVTQAPTGSGWSLQPRAFSAASLAVWTRQLAGLVGSGLPLERALTALAEEAETPRQRELVASLRAEVNAGNSVSRAMATAPREFDEVYRGVVAAGEASGALGPVLERLADDLEERLLLRTQVIGARA
ncbi:MAG: type II secretion system F family protein, partial [Inhella sp.]|uniref:type II secretion system F family protein n=1 Tax=Inhella sp. TaxID=1921806 RepID=UPI0022C22A55